MASNTNNGGGSHNHLPPSSSSVQDGIPYRHTYFSSQQDSGQRDHMDANMILTPIWFAAVFVAIICFLCSKVLRMNTEEEEAGGPNNGDTTAHQLQRNEAASGGVDRAPSSTVADTTTVEMAPPVQTAEPPPLVCTYQKADRLGEDLCGVCLADLAEGEAVRVLPACMHYFHAACIGEWLRVHATCPLCHAALVAPANATT